MVKIFNSMKTIKKLLLMAFGSLSIFIGLGMTVGFIAAWATHSVGPVYHYSFISFIGLALALIGVPTFFYVGRKWIRQAKKIY